MRRYTARVRNGRLVVDEPTDLPDGTELVLAPIDDLSDEERAALNEALREGLEQVRLGQTVDADEALAKLRAG